METTTNRQYRIYTHKNGMTELQIWSTTWDKWVTLHSEPYPHKMDDFATEHGYENTVKVQEK